MKITILDIFNVIESEAGSKINDEDSLLIDQGVDSVGLLCVIEKIEKLAGIEFLPSELSIENFASVRKIFEIILVAQDRQ